MGVKTSKNPRTGLTPSSFHIYVYTYRGFFGHIFLTQGSLAHKISLAFFSLNPDGHSVCPNFLYFRPPNMTSLNSSPRTSTPDLLKYPDFRIWDYCQHWYHSSICHRRKITSGLISAMDKWVSALRES